MGPLYYPKAIWVPGPAWKNSGPLEATGITGHSAVGFIGGLHDELFANNLKSWHFTGRYDGVIEQHYPIDVRTWHGQGAGAFTVGVEAEGGYQPENEAFTPEQLQSLIELFRWIAEVRNFVLARDVGQRTLFEHNEFYNKPCPSGRYPWEKFTMVNAGPTPRPLDIAAPDDKDLKSVIAAMANNRVKPVRYDEQGRAVYEMALDLRD